jgi:hypothetical protein
MGGSPMHFQKNMGEPPMPRYMPRPESVRYTVLNTALMKAVLMARAVAPPRTHDLGQLSRLLVACERGWAANEDDLQSLSDAAIDYRYPGEEAGQPDAAEAFRIASELRVRRLDLLR